MKKTLIAISLAASSLVGISSHAIQCKTIPNYLPSTEPGNLTFEQIVYENVHARCRNTVSRLNWYKWLAEAQGNNEKKAEVLLRGLKREAQYIIAVGGYPVPHQTAIAVVESYRLGRVYSILMNEGNSAYEKSLPAVPDLTATPELSDDESFKSEVQQMAMSSSQSSTVKRTSMPMAPMISTSDYGTTPNPGDLGNYYNDKDQIIGDYEATSSAYVAYLYELYDMIEYAFYNYDQPTYQWVRKCFTTGNGYCVPFTEHGYYKLYNTDVLNRNSARLARLILTKTKQFSDGFNFGGDLRNDFQFEANMTKAASLAAVNALDYTVERRRFMCARDSVLNVGRAVNQTIDLCSEQPLQRQDIIRGMLDGAISELNQAIQRDCWYRH